MGSRAEQLKNLLKNELAKKEKVALKLQMIRDSGVRNAKVGLAPQITSPDNSVCAVSEQPRGSYFSNPVVVLDRKFDSGNGP